MSDEGVSHQSDGCAGVVVVVRLKTFFCGSIKDTTDKVIFATHTQQVNRTQSLPGCCCCWESLYTVDDIIHPTYQIIYLFFFLFSCNTVPPVTISSFIPPPHDPKRKRCGQTRKKQRGNRHLQQVVAVVVAVVDIAGSSPRKKFSRSIVHKATEPRERHNAGQTHMRPGESWSFLFVFNG
jgi:hypothetical protein